MHLDKKLIQEALIGADILHDTLPQYPSFSIDSRTIQKGDIFVAIKGIHVDGHDFLYEAYQKGAVGYIVDKSRTDVLQKIPQETLQKSFVAAVNDPVHALLALARAWRAQFTYPVVAVTGSLGKTSTKEYIAHILRENGTPHSASYGNENTQLGVALNIFRMRAEHEVGVFEVGISARGEMVPIVDLLRPTNAIITCIGHQHMDGLGSLHDIAHEKRAVFTFFEEHNIGVLNGDQSAISAVGYSHPVVKFGSKTTNQIQARKIRVVGDEIHFTLKIYKKKYPIVLKHAHQGSVFNILAATALTHLLEVPDEVIVHAVQKPVRVAGRFEPCPMKKHQGILINDCYNANPESVKAALTALHNMDTQAKKVAVLGDMRGLGDTNAPFWHRQIGRFLRKISSLDKLILVGKDVAWVKKTAPVGLSVDIVDTWQEGVHALEGVLDTEALVLVKGSNDTGLTNLVDTFAERHPNT